MTQPFDLDVIQIASPCKVEWDSMPGDERVRHCGQCQLNVYNLGGMTRPEAEKLLATREGRVCVRFYRRADGTILTADCPAAWWDVRLKIARLAACIAAMVGFVWLGLASAFGRSESQPQGAIPPANPFARLSEDLSPQLWMGDICIPPPVIPPTAPPPAPPAGN